MLLLATELLLLVCVMTTEYPGKLIEIGLRHFISNTYNEGVGYSPKLDTRKLKPENTYISVFGPYQAGSMNVFLKDSRVKIIYQAKKAVNRRPGHGTDPRNTLFVWEFSPDTAQKEVQ
jgi:hypothetical protein